MHILKTTQTYYPFLSKGGPPVKIRGIARALVRRGHKITVLTANLDSTADSFADEQWLRERTRIASGWEWREPGIEAIYLRTLLNYRATTFNPGLVRFCVRHVKDFDLAHIYGLYDFVGSVVAGFCRRRRVPYIVEPLGMFRPKVRSLLKKRMYHAVIGSPLLQGAAAVIATSEVERNELSEAGVPPQKIVYRRNGLDLEEYASMPETRAFRSRMGIESHRTLILFLGRVSFIKGLDLLIESFAQLSSDAVLVIAGPDDKDGCREKVTELVKQFGLSDRVIQSGPLYGSAKLEALVDADLFVLPSRYESFGNAAAEAIASGTPVLVTHECGIAPLVDERAGRAVPCSVEGIRVGLQTLLADKSLLSRYASGCAELAKELSWEEPVEAMERLYASLISAPTLAADLRSPQSEIL